MFDKTYLNPPAGEGGQMAENKTVALCVHCKTHPQMPRAIIARACRSCNKALLRVVLAQAGRDPDTGAPTNQAGVWW